MSPALARPPTDRVMHLWRRQIGHRYAVADRRGPRPFAVIGFRVRGPLIGNRFVRLRHFTLTALYDQRLAEGDLVTRLVGVGGVTAPDGLCFGGPGLSRFDKDLRLPPATGRRGDRLDAADVDFCEYALAAEQFLERCARHPFMPRRNVPRLPVLAAPGESEQDLIDVTLLPKRQVIALTSPAALVGRVDSTTFDLLNTRFRVAS